MPWRGREAGWELFSSYFSGFGENHLHFICSLNKNRVGIWRGREKDSNREPEPERENVGGGRM